MMLGGTYLCVIAQFWTAKPSDWFAFNLSGMML